MRPIDLTGRIKDFRRLHRQALSWVITSQLPDRVVIAMGSRLTLMLMGQVLARPQRLCAAITTETEAREQLERHRPGLLICGDPLEEGDVASLCRHAHDQFPQIRLMLLLSNRQRVGRLAGLEAMVDALVLEEDLGGDDYPLQSAFIALARQRRYRSPGMRWPGAGRNPPPDGITTAQLTPRERQVLDLLSQGLGDRQIAAALGLSHETARTYVKAVRRKLGVGSRLMAARLRWDPESGN